MKRSDERKKVAAETASAREIQKLKELAQSRGILWEDVLYDSKMDGISLGRALHRRVHLIGHVAEDEMEKRRKAVEECDWYAMQDDPHRTGIGEFDGLYSAQVYAWKDDLSHKDAERFVREFETWRDAWVPTIEPMTVEAIREAILKGCPGFDRRRIRVEKLPNGSIQVGYVNPRMPLFLWKFTWHAENGTVQATHEHVDSLRDMLKCVDIVEALDRGRR